MSKVKVSILILLSLLFFGAAGYFGYTYFADDKPHKTAEPVTTTDSKSQETLLSEENNYYELKEIVISPENLTAKPGEMIELEILGKYVNLHDATELEKSLLVGDENYKKLELHSSDSQSAEVSIRKAAPVSGTITEKKNEPTIKIKAENEYKAYVTIPKEPLEDTVTITVEYDNKHTAEVVVKIEGVVKAVPKEEVKEIVRSLMEGVMMTFREAGEKYNWANTATKADFSLLRPELIKFASKSLTDGELKELSQEYYCQCDAPFFPSVEYDVRFTIHENTIKKMVASSIDIMNDLGNGGNTVYFTVIQENGKWVLDDWEYVDSNQEPLQLTWKEIETYEKQFDINVKLVKETTYQNRKVFIYHLESSNSNKLMFADTSEVLYEVPPELQE
ncbi:hypothetical protein J2Y03_004556 [Neobacillus niacini]|uniref:hypothetical protein n=1 Tax=Neobacillus niacini TaxID=86668 RepID=UPI002858368E|nr:hypothetical protein [Neobacillus niacini]MDR7079498.1 hypothetical protein [Neobacillus niacini]